MRSKTRARRLSLTAASAVMVLSGMLLGGVPVPTAYATQPPFDPAEFLRGQGCSSCGRYDVIGGLQTDREASRLVIAQDEEGNSVLLFLVRVRDGAVLWRPGPGEEPGRPRLWGHRYGAFATDRTGRVYLVTSFAAHAGGIIVLDVSDSRDVRHFGSLGQRPSGSFAGDVPLSGFEDLDKDGVFEVVTGHAAKGRVYAEGPYYQLYSRWDGAAYRPWRCAPLDQDGKLETPAPLSAPVCARVVDPSVLEDQ